MRPTRQKPGTLTGGPPQDTRPAAGATTEEELSGMAGRPSGAGCPPRLIACGGKVFRSGSCDGEAAPRRRQDEQARFRAGVDALRCDGDDA